MSKTEGMPERVFSDEYLHDAGMLTVDQIDRALDARNYDLATELVSRFEQEIQTMFYNYRGWEKGVLKELETLDGEGSAKEAISEIENADIAPERLVRGKEIIQQWRQVIDSTQQQIASHQTDLAKAQCRELFDDALQQHDGMMSRINALLTILHTRHGTDVLQKVLQEAMRPEVMDPDGTLPFVEKVEKIILFVRVHLTPFTLTEDHEKVTFMPDPCPSGGRLIQQGHFKAPRNGTILKDAGNLSWQRKNLPIYCCHEPAMEMSSIIKTGVPVFLVEPSEDLGRIPCKTYIYKDPKNIPDRFFKRLGLDRPEQLIASDH